MSIPKKAALAFAVSALLFAAFGVLAWLNLFGVVEMDFYAPSLIAQSQEKLKKETDALSVFFEGLTDKFSQTLDNGAVKRSFALEQNQIDVFERRRIFGEMQTAMPALQWVRFVDLAGNRIHFSTEEAADLAVPAGSTTLAYRAWTDVPRYFPITPDMALGNGGITFDGETDRILFYLPIFDESGARHGVALFCVTARSVTDELISKHFITFSEQISLFSEPLAIVTGLRGETDGTLRGAIKRSWIESAAGWSIVRSDQAGYMIFTQSTKQNIKVGLLVNEDIFHLPLALKALMLAVFGIIVYIALFWLLNLRQDPVTVIQHRMKRLQIELLREYFELKDDMDWAEWKKNLAGRREETRSAILSGWTQKKDEGVYAYVNSFFDKSWDDLLSVISSRSKSDMERLDEEKIEDILKRILRAAESVAKTNPPDFRQGSFDIETETVNTETFEDEAAGAEEMVEEIEDVEYLDEFEDEDEVAALYNAVPAAEESVEDDYSNFFPPVLPQNINAAGKGSDQKLEALSSAIHAEIRRNDLKNGTKNYSRDGSIWKYAITGKTKQKAAKTNEWSYLEADPFSGFDSEESKTSLNSDDFSYGIFVANKNAVPAQKPQSGMEQEGDPEAEKVTAQMPKDKASYKPPSNKKILKSPPEARAYKDSGREAAAPAPSKTAPASPVSFTQATEPPKATPAHTAPATPATATSAATFTKKSEAQEGVPVKMPPAHTTAAAAPPAAQAQEKPAIENEANIPVFLDSGLAPAPPDNIETFAEFAETDAVASTEDFAEELEELPSVNDSNQIAMRIEFAPENNSNNSNGWDHDFDKDMVITSPVDELFADVENDDVIKERGGVPYISTGGVLDKKEKEKLDPNIKTLVDSVLSP